MEAELHGLRVLCAKALLRDLRPDPPSGSEFCHLFKKIIVSVEEERQLAAEFVELQSGIDRRLDVRNGIGEGECDLLDRRRPSFANMITADRNRIPLRELPAAPLERIGHQSHG